MEVEFAVEAAAENFKISAFILNPPVENAVKHGFLTSAKPLKIKISTKTSGGKLTLEVVNAGKLENDSSANGTKIGLENGRERTDKLFGDRANFQLRLDGDFCDGESGTNFI